MTLVEAIKVTYAMVGQDISDLQLAMTAEKLKGYPLPAVMIALSCCQDQLRKITFTDILDRLPGGHPGPEEAWAIVSRGMNNEALTLVWTDEIREAYGVALGVGDDPVGARMAFKEYYVHAVNRARNEGKSPNWSVSQGSDKADRERAILEGVKLGRLSAPYAQRLLPHPDDPQTIALLEAHFPKLLGRTDDKTPPSTNEAAPQ